MNPDHAHVAEWDAAYVLGALSPADRRAYEEHQAECALCRDAFAELAPTVGLLSRVSAVRAREIDADADGPGPGAGLRGALVAQARRRRLRRRTAWGLGLAAAVLVVGAVAVPVTLAAVAPPPSFALTDVAGVPIQASVRLTDTPWGTRIDLVCVYTGEVLDAPEGGWPYALAVVDGAGDSTMLSTWRAAPGSRTELSAGTDLAVTDIGAVEIRTVDGSDVLMRYDAG